MPRFDVCTSTDKDGDGCLVIRRRGGDGGWLKVGQINGITDAMEGWLAEKFPDLGEEDDEPDTCEDCGCEECECSICECGAKLDEWDQCPNGCHDDEEDSDDEEDDEEEPEPELTSVSARPILDTFYRQPSAADRFFA